MALAFIIAIIVMWFQKCIWNFLKLYGSEVHLHFFHWRFFQISLYQIFWIALLILEKSRNWFWKRLKIKEIIAENLRCDNNFGIDFSMNQKILLCCYCIHEIVLFFAEFVTIKRLPGLLLKLHRLFRDCCLLTIQIIFHLFTKWVEPDEILAKQKTRTIKCKSKISTIHFK